MVNLLLYAPHLSYLGGKFAFISCAFWRSDVFYIIYSWFCIVRFLLIFFKFEWYTTKNQYIIWRSCKRILSKIWHYGLKIICIYNYITKDYIILYHIINMVRIMRLYICAYCDLLFAHNAACCLRIMRLIICAYCGLLLAHNAAFLLVFCFTVTSWRWKSLKICALMAATLFGSSCTMATSIMNSLCPWRQK